MQLCRDVLPLYRTSLVPPSLLLVNKALEMNVAKCLHCLMSRIMWQFVFVGQEECGRLFSLVKKDVAICFHWPRRMRHFFCCYWVKKNVAIVFIGQEERGRCFHWNCVWL